jgi:predicted HTH transcriptional regulator
MSASARQPKSAKIRVFISSVQGELHNERKAARVLLSGDPALGPHCVPVTLPGPGEDLARLKIPPSKVGGILPQKVTGQLNERQRKMAELLASGETLTSRRCEKVFGVSRQTTSADFALLINLKIATRIGSGRSTAYALFGGK